MNWRRGLLLAGIHLVVAGTLIVWVEAPIWKYLRSDTEPAPAMVLKNVIWQEGEQTVTFSPDPCSMWTSMPEEERILVVAELPAVGISELGGRCSPQLPLARFFIKEFGEATRKTEVSEAICCLVLVVLQWYLIGSFPFVRSGRRWWAEPGAFITVCAVLGAAIAAIPHVDFLSRIPQSLALLAWLWWFILLVWTLLRAGWRLLIQRKPQAA